MAVTSTLSVPLKTVVPWYADLATGTTPPAGWAVCDGTTLNTSQQDIIGSSWTLPDLRNKFILGASLTNADGVPGVATTSGSINAAAGAPGPKGVGGSNKIDIVEGNLPMDSGAGSGGSVDHNNHAGTVTTPADNRPNYYGLVYIMKVKH